MGPIERMAVRSQFAFLAFTVGLFFGGLGLMIAVVASAFKNLFEFGLFLTLIGGILCGIAIPAGRRPKLPEGVTVPRQRR